jgi:hypothetical protein
MKRVVFRVWGSRGELVVYHYRPVLEVILPVKNPLDPHGELELYSEVEYDGEVPLYENPALLDIWPARYGRCRRSRPGFEYCVWYDDDAVIEGTLPEAFSDLFVHQILYDVPSDESWTEDRVVDVVRHEVLPLLDGALEALGQGRLASLDGAKAWVESERIVSGRMPRMRLAAYVTPWEGYKTVAIIPYEGCCVSAWSLRKTGRYLQEHLFSREHLENVYGREFAEKVLSVTNRQ